METLNRSSETQLEGWVVEHIAGPFDGFYVGGYACAIQGGGFQAYLKIFSSRPVSVWEPSAHAKVSSHSPMSHRSALALTQERAVRYIQRWLEPRRLDIVLP